MTTGTHILVGGVAYAVMASLRGWSVGPVEVVGVIAGAVMPDADLPSSAVGRALGPVSRWIHRRFGHRTVLHSAWGVGVVLLLAFWSEAIGRALATGYVSHLLADTLNPQGIRFLWPARVMFRFFRNPRYHMEVGRRGEHVFLVMMVLALALYWPVGRMGFRRMMHRAMKDIASAVMDYQAIGERYETFLRVIEGTEVATGLPVEGRFRVVAALTPNELLVEADEDRLWVIGEGQGVHVYPRRCVLERGELQRVEVGEFDLSGRMFRDLREHLEGKRAYMTGSVVMGRGVRVLPHGDRYETVVGAGDQLVLKYARWRDVEKFQDEMIVQGRVRVKWVSRVGEEAGVLGAADGRWKSRASVSDGWASSGRVRVVEIGLRRVEELRVRVGEWLRRGQVIAVREEKERELEGLEAEARWRRLRFAEALRGLEVEERQLRAGALDVSEEGSVEGARWRWEQAEGEYRRKLELHREGVVSDQELERARATAEARRARYEELRGVRERRLSALEVRRRELELEERRAEEEYRRRRERLLRERDVFSPVEGEVVAIDPVRSEGEGVKVRVLVREGKRNGERDGEREGKREGNRNGEREVSALWGEVRVERVVDGDTVDVRIGGREERVRLIGVDAPELGQGVWGERAREVLRRWVEGRVVRLERDVVERDRYGRVLAYVWVDGRLVNEELLREGVAMLYTVPPNVRHVERLRRAQEEARAAGRGVWGRGGLRERPWEYRRHERGRSSER